MPGEAVFGTLPEKNRSLVAARDSFNNQDRGGRVVKVNKRIKYSIYSIALLLVISSCKDQITDPNSNPIVFPDANVSYSKHVEPLFQQRCALSGCHAGSSAQAGLDLFTPSYSSLINHQPRLVNPGASNNSLLVQRIDGRIAPQMPYLSQPLTANQISGFKKWIDEGAKNN
ncbi:MAG: hypothetical protein HW407_864 [Bacteroidetes bacterium]|nr:hypothetical protein [Bacteroidota bacterium]